MEMRKLWKSEENSAVVMWHYDKQDGDCDMGKVIYVNGSIFIDTRYFVPKELGCGYEIAPVGAETIEATDEIEGIRWLVIDDEHPQSLFNEYYAKGGVSTEKIATSYFSASYIDCINEYKKRIGETCEVIKKVQDWDAKEQSLVNKMAYVNIVTALDAFICYVLLRRSLKDEFLFEKLMNCIAPKSKQESWNKLKESGCIGEWEQDAIRYVLQTSFINTGTLDKAIKLVGFDRLVYDRKELDGYFRIRHLIVHRSGRQRNDDEVEVTYDMLAKLINVCHNLVGAIFDSVCITMDREYKNRPKERDIEEIFPGGVVRMPFKLSDLVRLLSSGKEKKEFEPIEMPVL